MTVVAIGFGVLALALFIAWWRSASEAVTLKFQKSELERELHYFKIDEAYTKMEKRRAWQHAEEANELLTYFMARLL